MRHKSALMYVPAALAALGLAAAAAPVAQADTGAGDSASMHSHHSSTASSAEDRIRAAAKVVALMKQDPKLAALLHRAKGVFIVPHYGKGAFIVGGQGGGGVVLANDDGTWSNPAFFNIGGASVGAQAGGEGGSVAMLLMTRKAVDKFANSNSTWSLNGNAGLTVVTWSGKEQVESGNGDVIVWSNTRGLYGGLTAGVTDIVPEGKLDRAYYGKKVDARQILHGSVLSASADPLRNALAAHYASR